jgi:NADH-quinone oxidoreductase subunit N
MLAYSSIAHMGYLALGLIAATPEGYAAASFYAINYALMSAGAFGLLTLLSRADVEIDHFADLQGLNTHRPWLALMLLIILFSMAGIPPVIGFYAKLAVLQALIHVQYIGLATIAILTSVIGAYYYLRVIKVMYFDAPQEGVLITKGSAIQRVTLSINGLLILALGIMPNGLWSLCRQAFSG